MTIPNVELALEFAKQHGTNDGAHHKMWVIDQMVRALTGCPMIPLTAIDAHGEEYTCAGQGESDDYRAFVKAATAGEDGPETYEWDVGIAP